MKVKMRKEELPRANKIFTDREEPRKSFWKNYKKVKANMAEENTEICVLSYYGIGGIGKSSLLKKLISEMNEEIKKPSYAYYDLNIKQDCRSVLVGLRNILSNSYNFNFSLFDMGVYNYAQKIGEDVSRPEIKAFTEKSNFLNWVLSAAEPLPIVGWASQIIRRTDEAVAIARTVLNNHKLDLTNIDNKSPEELYAHLPYLFAQDLADNLENEEEPLVIFLDTYEQLVNEMISVGEPLCNDEWLRGEKGLITHTPNVLWVIAGREKLKWEKFDPDWKTSLEQHILGTLSETDARQFLESAGVSDHNLVGELYELTNGTPVYLDLCVDRYMAIIESGRIPHIDDFGKDIYSLVVRFARYMDDAKKDVAYMLSCLQLWDDKMVFEIGGKIIPSFSLSGYEKVKGFSFITESNEGYYTIHQTIASVLREICPDIIRKSTIDNAAAYCKERIDSDNVVYEEYEHYFYWYVKYELQRINSNELYDFYKNNISDYFYMLKNQGRFDLAHKILDLFFGSIDEQNNIQHNQFICELADLNIDEGNYSEALVNCQKCLEYFDNAENININVFFRVYSVYGETLSKLGRYEDTLFIQEFVYEKHSEIFGENHQETLVAQYNLASTLSNLGRYEEALAIQERLYEKNKENFGEGHQNTLAVQNSLASELRNLGRYEEALAIQEQVYEKCKEILGEDDLNSLNVQNNLAVSLSYLGRYEEALVIQEFVYEKYCAIFGENHPETLIKQHNLTSALNNLGRYEEALANQEQVYEKFKEIFGEDHPNTMTARNSLAIILRNLDRYEEAQEYEGQV